MEENNYIEIDLVEIGKLLWSHILQIVVLALVCGALTLSVTAAAQPPQYDASIMVYVNNSSVNLSNGLKLNVSGDQLTAAQKLADTYIVILNSTTTLEEIIEKADLKMKPDQLKSMITSSTVNDTEVFQVTVRSGDPAESALIANTILKVLPKRISSIVSGSDIATVDYARVPTTLASPHYTRNTAIGLLIGLILACLLIIIANLMDKNIHSTDWMTQNYPDVPLLATIPDIEQSATTAEADVEAHYLNK